MTRIISSKLGHHPSTHARAHMHIIDVSTEDKMTQSTLTILRVIYLMISGLSKHML